jgi:hypothetical protein
MVCWFGGLFGCVFWLLGVWVYAILTSHSWIHRLFFTLGSSMASGFILLFFTVSMTFLIIPPNYGKGNRSLGFFVGNLALSIAIFYVSIAFYDPAGTCKPAWLDVLG